MSIHTAGWAAIGASATAIISVLSNIYLAKKNRSQLIDQASNQLKQAAASHDVQRISTVRTAATFIADKRQKWIDELRSDIATHLAESQEYLWKWDSMRARTAEVENDKTLSDTERTIKATDLRHAFSEKNGAIDRSHQERHHRLRFRLNPKEPEHLALRNVLEEIREAFGRTQGAKTEAEAVALMKIMKLLVDNADKLTSAILKTEWERVKQEAAYPEQMIAKIPPPA